MLGCQMLFGTERAVDVQRMVEEATGEMCPCLAGRECPLVPILSRGGEPRLAESA